VDLQAPDVAGDVTITLPNATGPFALESYVDAAVAAIPAIAGIGSNVVQTLKKDVFSTTSATFTATGLSATITPSSATSKVLVIAQLMLGGSQTGGQATNVILTGGNTSGFIGDASGNQVQAAFGTNYNGTDIAYTADSVTLTFLDSPSTTSATTYGVDMRRGTGGTAFLNRQGPTDNFAYMTRGVSSLTLIEVAA
jgi:hypothetical protein